MPRSGHPAFGLPNTEHPDKSERFIEEMKLLITGKIPDTVLASLEAAHQVEMNPLDRPMNREKILTQVRDKDGLLCMITDRIDRELMASAPHLKIIANYGVGFNHIDLKAATGKRIVVTNTPDVLTDATADLTFALILAVGRRVVEGDTRTRRGKFQFWAPMHFLGREITGKTLGIVGFGRIGRAVAKRAAGFGMPVIYHQRNRLDPHLEKALNATYAPLDRLLENSDVVSLHLPLTPETTHLIGRCELRRMKPASCLINTSRGPVVDEAALVRALRNKEIYGAGLDVYEQEPALAPGLSQLDNVVLLPHVGSATIETRTRMAEMAAENLLSFFQGKKPPNCLNCHDLYDDETNR